MRVLFVTSECVPLIKTGGLADVSAALPAALTRLSVDVRILLPGYRSVLERISRAREVARLPPIGQFPRARLLSVENPGGASFLVADSPELYLRAGGPYMDDNGADWPDNALRFGQLCRVAVALSCDASPLAWKPDVVHCNDWQTGLVPAYLRFDSKARAATLVTVHNLAFQGVFPPQTQADLGLSQMRFDTAGLEYYGQLSFLKAALYYADAITTVSPTYALEIQREPLGMGLQSLLAERRKDLVGILNGIDVKLWAPASDPLIERPYGADSLENKFVNKAALQNHFHLPQNASVPVLGVVSRLAHQKGIDLIAEAAEALFKLPAQLVVLGTGEHDYEQRLRDLASANPGRIGVHIGFDEALAHQIEAGADMFLMPSRYEPCGMNQMYSQRYGTVPVVHATGGLVDSVVDCTPETLASGTATGFVFHRLNSASLIDAVSRAATLFRDRGLWRALQTAGMAHDFGWDASARRYLQLYSRLASQLTR